MKRKQLKPEIAKKIKPHYFSNFIVGEMFCATISSFESSKIFHVVKNENLDKIKTTAELDNVFWIPTVYDTFYILSEGKYIRCARLPVEEDVDSSVYMKLYLEDTGESYNVAIETLSLNYGLMFMIPETIRKVPGLAIRCIWQEISEELECEHDDAFVENNVYKTFTFEVLEVSEDKIAVIILPYDDSSFESDNSDISSPSNSKKLEQESTKSILEESDEDNEGVDLKLLPLESQPELSASSEHELCQSQDSQEQDGRAAITKSSLLPKQLEAWMEEPLNTADPQIAVEGFRTRDEDNLCRFYDPAIGGCFKGGRCKQIHLSELTDGTCRDRKEVFYNIAKSLPVPDIGSKIEIEVTQVKNFKTLLCRFVDQESLENEVDVQVLFDHMNLKNQVKDYRALTEQPAIKELVVAKFDNRFYRGRVEDWADTHLTYEVLLLDLGLIKNFRIKDLFSWSQRFVYFPFQTIEIVIANIQPFAKNDKVAEKKLKDLIKESGEYFSALVVDNFCCLECVLFSKKNEDIGKKLISEGFVDGKTLITSTTYKRTNIYPG